MVISKRGDLDAWPNARLREPALQEVWMLFGRHCTQWVGTSFGSWKSGQTMPNMVTHKDTSKGGMGRCGRDKWYVWLKEVLRTVDGVAYKTCSRRSHVASMALQFHCYLARVGNGELPVQKEQGMQTTWVRKCSWLQARTFRWRQLKQQGSGLCSTTRGLAVSAGIANCSAQWKQGLWSTLVASAPLPRTSTSS